MPLGKGKQNRQEKVSALRKLEKGKSRSIAVCGEKDQVSDLEIVRSPTGSTKGT